MKSISVVGLERFALKIEYRVRTSALCFFDQLVSSLGGDPAAILKRFGLTMDALASERDSMDISQLVRLLDHCAFTLNCPEFGLRLGISQDFRILGPLGLLVENCETVREANKALRSFMAFHNQSEYWDTREYQQTVVIQRFDSFNDAVDSRQYKELAMSACFHLCHLLIGNKFKPKWLEFTHAPLTDVHRYTKIFGIDVRFNQERDALVLEKGFLDLPIQGGDEGIKQLKAQYLAALQKEFQQDIVHQVTTLIQQTLGSQEASIANIAHLLNMNKRTLQRRLKTEGADFRELINETRYKNARWYLASSDMSITLLSEILGYSDMANFTRAFRKSSGLSPLAWRNRQRLRG